MFPLIAVKSGAELGVGNLQRKTKGGEEARERHYQG
jgi:hypothetical protein